MLVPQQPSDERSIIASGFVPRLESMRGYAAVSVLAFHACMMSWDMVAGGMAPVVVFFVLSGFLLGRSLDRDPDPFLFVRHRLFRLLPAAVTTVLLLTLAFKWFGFYVGYLPSFDLPNILMNAFLIKSDINGVMWSLTVECVAVPVILLSHALLRRRGATTLWSLVAVLVAASFWGAYVHLLGGYTNLGPLYAFIVGMLVHAGRPRKISAWGRQRLTALAAAAFVVMVIVAVRKQTAVTIFFETVCASVLIWIAAFGPGSLRVMWPFDLSAARFYGKISYSFYLLHMASLGLANHLLPLDQPPLMRAAILFLAAMVITTPAAWLMWWLIEVPFIKFGRRKPRRLAQA